MAALSGDDDALASSGGAASVTIERLRELSQTAYRAAREAWRSVALPDEEEA